MSTNTIEHTLDLLPAAKRTQPPHGSLNAIRSFFASIREGIDAAHEYERLIGRGMPPQQAVDRVFREHFADRR